MTREEVVLVKAAQTRKRLERVREAIAVGRESFVADEDRIERAAFNLFLAMQEAIDLASHVVADEQWGAPETLAEAFDLLERNGAITATTAGTMRRGVKLRNVVAHTYAAIDPAKLFGAATAGVDEIERFLGEIGAWLAAGGRSPER